MDAEGDTSVVSALSKSKKSMLMVLQLSNAKLEEILFTKIEPCPYEKLESDN